MKRPTSIWLTFLLFLALGLGAMGWMTHLVLKYDAAQNKATAEAQMEENVRLALWRMDSVLAPIVSQENARPYFEYSAVFPAERAYTRMYTELKSGDVLVPSPLLRGSTNYAANRSASPFVLLHFQLAPDGAITSPQAPIGEVKKIAEARYSTSADIAAAAVRLEQVRKIVAEHEEQLAVFLPVPPTAEEWGNNKLRVNSNGQIGAANYNGGTIANGTISINPNRDPANNTVAQMAANGRAYNNSYAPQQQGLSQQPDPDQQKAIQQLRGQQEFAVRAQTVDNNNDLYIGNNSGYLYGPGVSAGVMKPFWADASTLLLARKVTINGAIYYQGCLLDWAAIRPWLIGSTADLVPQADLLPDLAADRASPTDKQPRMLATIPARLMVNPAALGQAGAEPSFIAALIALSPLHVTLTIAWAGVILASAAVAVLLRGVISLSQRRAGFVSAVTHELRTPLTTLRMYTEMLADGMVSDPEKQAAYHKTLRAEANRLGHLVDNVLLYSRLERSTRDAKVEAAPLADLLDRLVPRLTDRAAQAGMTLELSANDSVRNCQIRANLLSVEQILFNLVDNACKYASAAPDKRIELTIERAGERIKIKVRDHGPGLDVASRAKLFEPFSKSVNEAANSAPGLGLGLALSRRLAANMGADLRLDETVRNGAGFVLKVPGSF